MTSRIEHSKTLPREENTVNTKVPLIMLTISPDPVDRCKSYMKLPSVLRPALLMLHIITAAGYGIPKYCFRTGVLHCMLENAKD